MTAQRGRLGLGIAGLGIAGGAMLAAALCHDRVDVVAVADPSVDDLALPDHVGAYAALDALLEDPRVEAVHVATPTPLHRAHVQSVLAAGRHVIVEKPVTVHSAEAGALADVAARRHLAVIVGHSESFEPQWAATRAALRAGQLGEIVNVTAEKLTDWMRRPRRPEELRTDLGGGIVRRQGVHQVDVVRSFLPGVGFEVGRARLHCRDRDGVPFGYTAWLDAGEAPVLLVQDGSGVRSGAGAALAADEPSDAARSSALGEEKRERARRRIEEAISAGALLVMGRADLERVAVLGTEGWLVGSANGVVVERRGEVTDLDLRRWPDGRSAVLDELLSVLDGDSSFHDLAWGAENLRLCEAIDDLGQRVLAEGRTGVSPPRDHEEENHGT